MKIVFFGTSAVGLPVLNALQQQHELAGVVTSPDAPVGRTQLLTPSPVSAQAAPWGIPIWKPARVKNNSELLETLKAVNADIFIVVSYGKFCHRSLLTCRR